MPPIIFVFILGVAINLFLSPTVFAKTCQGSHRNFRAGLCYKGCRPGYHGVGPVCWSSTSCGDLHINDGAFCRKKSYGRGVGKPLNFHCRSGEELNGLLCYKNCRGGYNGVGPVCWQRCRSGYRNHGATCYKSFFRWYFKKSYGRGVGRAADNGCSAGYEKGGALCYPVCRSGYKGVGPVCWARGCPPGMHDIGVSCAKHSYGRGAGIIPKSCSSSSFNRSSTTTVTSQTSFSLIIANDPQIVWWTDSATGDPCNGSESCKEGKAKNEALSQVRGMNGVQTLGLWPGTSKSITKPEGVIINGDLTSYFHPNEFDLFHNYYVKGSNSPNKDVLDYKLFLGLGNHDYQNNVNDCWWAREPSYFWDFANGCATKASDFMKVMMSCGGIEGFPADKIESYNEGSRAYSWNMGSYHFIQLHNYPTYSESSIGVGSSMDWLEKDLIKARAASKHIIVNLHDLDDKFTGTDQNDFGVLLSTYGVVGIFCGHWTAGNNLGTHANFHGIPIFRGGHGGEQNRNKFLLVDFTDTAFQVVAIDTVSGSPQFVDTTTGPFNTIVTV